jgi:hypothetical protein
MVQLPRIAPRCILSLRIFPRPSQGERPPIPGQPRLERGSPVAWLASGSKPAVLKFPFQVGRLANTTTTRISRPFDAPAPGLPAGWIPGSAGRPQTPRHLSNCAAFTPFNAGHVRAGDVGYWNTGARLTPDCWIASAHGGQRFLDPVGTDGVDPDPARHSQRGGAHEAVHSGVHHALDATPRRRVGPEGPAGQREGATVADSVKAVPYEVDLAHELDAQSELEVRVGELAERLVGALPGGADHCVDRPEPPRGGLSVTRQGRYRLVWWLTSSVRSAVTSHGGLHPTARRLASSLVCMAS